MASAHVAGKADRRQLALAASALDNGETLNQRLIAAVAVLLSGSSLGARQSGIKGVDLPADPLIPIPLYHETRAQRLADELAKLKPAALRAAAPLGIGPTAITLLVTSDALFPGEMNGSLGRIVFYSGIINGFVKSQIVHKGMTQREIWRLFADCEGGIYTDIGGSTHCLETLGVSVHVPFFRQESQPVADVKWRPRWFEPRRLTAQPNR